MGLFYGSNILNVSSLGFGVSDKVDDLLVGNNKVKEIILDSAGGRVYGGRKLYQIIINRKFNTYSTKGCYSACGTAFISGEKRFLTNGANLAFHQYRNSYKSLSSSVKMTAKQRKDLEIYKKKNLSQMFINNIFLAEKDDLWYPTIDEMLKANVIHGVINSLDIISTDYKLSSSNEIIKILDDISLFTIIKKYEPELYKKILVSFETKLEQGATPIEIQQDAAKYIETIALKYLPITSNKALIKFGKETSAMLSKLESKDPILCIKALYPARYGAINAARHLSKNDMTAFNDSLGFMISDSYSVKQKRVNIEQAEKLFVQLMPKLGEDARYHDEPELKNKDDYSRAARQSLSYIH